MIAPEIDLSSLDVKHPPLVRTEPTTTTPSPSPSDAMRDDEPLHLDQPVKGLTPEL